MEISTFVYRWVGGFVNCLCSFFAGSFDLGYLSRLPKMEKYIWWGSGPVNLIFVLC